MVVIYGGCFWHLLPRDSVAFVVLHLGLLEGSGDRISIGSQVSM